MPEGIRVLPVFSPIGGRPPEVSMKREFQLNNFRPIIGQEPGRRGTKDHVGEIQDADLFQYFWLLGNLRRVEKLRRIGKIFLHSYLPR
jgi:hypothetical protein